jgi:hypothetical protein
VIPPGYYTYQQLVAKMVGSFKVHESTLKVSYSGTLTGGLTNLIKDGYLYLTPLSLYLCVEGIDSSKNLLDGKRSNLLSIIPIGKTNIGEIFQYQPVNNYKRMYVGEINDLRVSIVDESGSDYSGKFVAELELQ